MLLAILLINLSGNSGFIRVLKVKNQARLLRSINKSSGNHYSGEGILIDTLNDTELRFS